MSAWSVRDVIGWINRPCQIEHFLRFHCMESTMNSDIVFLSHASNPVLELLTTITKGSHELRTRKLIYLLFVSDYLEDNKDFAEAYPLLVKLLSLSVFMLLSPWIHSPRAVLLSRNSYTLDRRLGTRHGAALGGMVENGDLTVGTLGWDQVQHVDGLQSTQKVLRNSRGHRPYSPKCNCLLDPLTYRTWPFTSDASKSVVVSDDSHLSKLMHLIPARCISQQQSNL
ncbi:hypothetical protein ABKN59_007560 [Abortiporus biennis]